MMNAIPRPVVKALHTDINKALAEVATKHGFTFVQKSMRFDDARVTGRMEFVKQGAETTLANRLGEQNGLDLKVGEAVTAGHKSYTVKGFTPRGKVIIEDARGKQYKAHSYQLKRSNATHDDGVASVLARLNSPNGPNGVAVSMSDLDLTLLIQRFIPGLNRNATKSVLHDWKWKSLGNDNAKRSPVPMPKTEAEVKERCEEYVKEARESYSGNGNPLKVQSNADAIQLLNEGADENAWEARVS